MPGQVPNQFYFRFAFQTRRLPKLDDELTDDHLLPFVGGLNNLPELAKVWLGWSDEGLAIQWETIGKRRPVEGHKNPGLRDGLWVWIDLRDARSARRASRFCHTFGLLVHDGEAIRPCIAQGNIPRAIEDAPTATADSLQARLWRIDDRGRPTPYAAGAKLVNYRMRIDFLRDALHGFDPENHSRLGFFYRLADHERGEQTLTAGSPLPFLEDPSLWSVLELTR